MVFPSFTKAPVLPLSKNFQAALLMTLSTGAFVLNDAMTKLASQTLNMGEVMAVRGVFATTMIWLLCWKMGVLRLSASLLSPIVMLRTAMDAAATVTYLLALQQMPLNNVVAIFQTLPLVITMGAALFFGEEVGWRRWLAITVGFCGVLLIIRPGFEGFNVFALLVLASVAFCAVRDSATRYLPKGISTLEVSAVTASANLLLGIALIVPLGGWQPVDMRELTILFSAAVTVIAAYLMIIPAMRMAEISFVASFRYVALLWSGIAAWFIFAEIPDSLTLAGAVLIAGSGIYTLYRERIKGRQRAALARTAQG